MKKTDEFEGLKRALLEAVEVSHGRAKAARVSVREIESVQEVRQNLKLPRAEFARLLGVSVRTVEGWEQGRRNPSGAAKMLLWWQSEVLKQSWMRGIAFSLESPETRAPQLKFSNLLNFEHGFHRNSTSSRTTFRTREI